MLRACRAVLRPGGGGALAFTTIHLAPDLSPEQRRRAVEAGPRAVTHRSRHRRLLRTAGFDDVRHEDWTGEFHTAARGWLEAGEQHADELAAAEGREQVEERQRSRAEVVAAIEDGLLRRSAYLARLPDGKRSTGGPL